MAQRGAFCGPCGWNKQYFCFFLIGSRFPNPLSLCREKLIFRAKPAAVPTLQPPSSSEPDEMAGWARLAVQGDAAAIRQILLALGPSVTRTVRHVLGKGHPDQDDVLQETLMMLLRALPTWRGESRLSHFASCIGFRCALKVKRRQRTTKAWLEQYVRLESDAMQPAQPNEETAAERRRRLLAELLARLPEAQAETLGLRFFLGLSIEEVASLTAVPANTVRSRLRLAKEALLGEMQSDARWAELREFAS